MDKTVKINLNGTLFQASEDAYKLLRDYLKAIDGRFSNMKGSLETIEDIESRIAEILINRKGPAGVIEREDVEHVISILGKPEDFDINEPVSGGQGYYSNRRVLYRNPGDVILGGVCSGIAAYMNIQAVWVRIAFVIFFLMWGLGLLIYLGLWIALPKADTEARKRELFGERYDRNAVSARSGNSSNSAGDFGNAVNQVFMAIGRVIYTIVRIILVCIGIVLSISGAAMLMVAILMFFFKSPGFMPGTFEGNFFFLPDFLEFVVAPSVSPWILVLGFLAVVLPLLAMIYWGVRMIFWFKARDGVLSIIALVVWVMSITGLSLLLANQGLSFSEHEETTTAITASKSSDTLHVVTMNRVGDLKYDRAFSVPDESYAIYMNSDSGILYIRAGLKLETGEEDRFEAEIEKTSSGRSNSDAAERAEELPFNIWISGDTLYLDEYFQLSKSRKWSGDFVKVTLKVPENTVVTFDRASENMFDEHIILNNNYLDDPEPWALSGKKWKITENEMTEVTK